MVVTYELLKVPHEISLTTAATTKINSSWENSVAQQNSSHYIISQRNFVRKLQDLVTTGWFSFPFHVDYDMTQ